MTTLAQINGQAVPVITYHHSPVITTEMLAKFYGTEVKNIQNNFARNLERFIEGKHFLKIQGAELKCFRLRVNNIHEQNLQPSLSGSQISPKTRSLILWTERGAARHAKMLDTDQAWDVFEMLEDSYFILKEENREPKTTVADRIPLIHAVATLVATSGHLNYSDAYRLVHQRFGVEHVEQLSHAQVKEAVEYVHMLIAACTQIPPETLALIKKFVEAVLTQNFMLSELWQALLLINKKQMLNSCNYVVTTYEMARELSRTLNFTNRGVPLISPDCRKITFENHGFTISPNWFNMEA